jgi:hypothetical protein
MQLPDRHQEIRCHTALPSISPSSSSSSARWAARSAQLTGRAEGLYLTEVSY